MTLDKDIKWVPIPSLTHMSVVPRSLIAPIAELNSDIARKLQMAASRQLAVAQAACDCLGIVDIQSQLLLTSFVWTSKEQFKYAMNELEINLIELYIKDKINDGLAVETRADTVAYL